MAKITRKKPMTNLTNMMMGAGNPVQPLPPNPKKKGKNKKKKKK
jgi:hypothetical protein